MLRVTLDGIITTDFTRGYVNALHVFSIIEPDSFALSRSLIARSLSPRTKTRRLRFPFTILQDGRGVPELSGFT